MTVAIRPARLEDLPRLHAIWRAAVDATHGFVAPDDLAAIGEQVRDAYLPAADLLIAVDADGRPVGWLGRDARTIGALFVDPACHGRGIGRALVAAAFGAADPVRVDVNAANAGALAFWQRLGFVEHGRSPVDDAGRPYPLIHLSRRDGKAPISAA